MAVVRRDSSRSLRTGSRFRDDAGFTAVEMLTVAAIIAMLGAIAAPMFGNMLGNYRLSGDARGISNSIAVAKMRAASDFTQTRLYVDLGAKTYHIEYWRRSGTPGWITEGGTTYLATQDRFSFSLVSVPPPNTQTAIGQAVACTDDAGAAITGTACVMFSSRGLPIDAAGAPTAANAYYLTDNTAVYGITIAATGMIRTWRTPATTTPSWSLQ
jgi:prepilin-type N-terminal cleavage/methylation domain-containing protein